LSCEELFDSRDVQLGLNPTATLQFVIKGTPDHDAALAELNATFPSTVSGIPAQSYRVAPVSNDIWLGTVRYGTNAQSTGQTLYQFDTGGGSQHITNSIATVARYAPAGRTPANFQGAIGVSKNDVAGVDIVVPVYNWNEVKFHANSDIDAAYRLALFTLTGRVNNAAWKGYAVGEVLFMGASGAKRGNENWEIMYRFAASPNLAGLTVGAIAGIAKRGWEYMWVQYEAVEDAAAKMLIKVPASVHIEQVYHYGDFSTLKL
jgi:hypothetical protein